MGLTLISKSEGRPPKKNPRIALVLAGGAMTGGAFKVGGVKALNDYLVGRGLCDLDTYVGLSAGSILAVPFAGGIEPDEMIRVLDGESEKFDQLRPFDFYRPNTREFLERPLNMLYDFMSYLPGVSQEFLQGLPGLPESAGEEFRAFIREPNYGRFESLVTRMIEHTSPSRRQPSVTDYIPTGIFDNSSIENWFRRNLDRLSMPNDFAAFSRTRQVDLYLTACDLDTAERVVFGAGEVEELTIAQAIQASTALPVFYKPARLNGIDYVDGGVRHTANIDVAIEKGSDLIICYNPFRPFLNRVDPDIVDPAHFAEGRYLSDRGMKLVINQVFRTLLHSRLELGLQRYAADRKFRGDIVLLEPQERDADFFALNPLAFWHRSEALQHGFQSVRGTVERNFDLLEPVLARYGLEMSRETARLRAEELCAERGWAPEPKPGDSRGSTSHLRVIGEHG